MEVESSGVVRRTTLRDHLGHHPGMYSLRSCRPLLSLGRQKFRAKTTKTTPSGSRRKGVKERGGAVQVVEEGESIKTVLKMGLHSESSSCCPDPRHICEHGNGHVRSSNPPARPVSRGES